MPIDLWSRLVFALIAVVGIYKSVKKLWINRQRVAKERQFQCEPAFQVKSNPWKFGIDVVLSMSEDYNSGKRNTKLQKQFEDLGNTFETRAADASRIYTVDLENVKTVFGGPNEEWGLEAIRLEAFRPAFGGGVLVTDGTRWKNARKPCVAVIDKVYRDRTADLSQMDSKIQQLYDLLPVKGTTFDIGPLLSMYMIDSASEYIFGKTVDSLIPGKAGDPGRKFLFSTIAGLDHSGERDEVPQWTLEGIKSRIWDTSAERFRPMHQFAEKYIRQAIDEVNQASSSEKDTTPVSLAHEWAKVIQDPAEIRSQLLNVLVAAFDTTAITLQNAFFHLSRNPSAYRKLRAEVLNARPDLTLNQLKSLTYLNNVVRETLRLNTPATFNSRIAMRDTTIPRGGGPDGTSPVFIAQGDLVVTSVYAIQRNREVYGADADDFRPDRWERHDVRPGHWDYLPFSAGPRVCPGQNLALAHAAYVLFYLVRRIARVECRDPVDEYVEIYRVTTSSRNGTKVALYAD